ncbi:uncharacterized protein CLUP02_05981 [Colletotrichum lupini]|uniref:Uncharacterized protein n=1 Tax=Colletotrichum lupini TaxID=145971 RepID=A0A9Q8WE90_9PEZI|nr:uncharacterized protein CLUP02_05981 [Colletotrichum lupini]UQC80498.1 hypothetical protein CLUP02_05981 [Colletotrichum lupini]
MADWEFSAGGLQVVGFYGGFCGPGWKTKYPEMFSILRINLFPLQRLDETHVYRNWELVKTTSYKDTAGGGAHHGDASLSTGLTVDSLRFTSTSPTFPYNQLAVYPQHEPERMHAGPDTFVSSFNGLAKPASQSAHTGSRAAHRDRPSKLSCSLHHLFPPYIVPYSRLWSPSPLSTASPQAWTSAGCHAGKHETRRSQSGPILPLNKDQKCQPTSINLPRITATTATIRICCIKVTQANRLHLSHPVNAGGSDNYIRICVLLSPLMRV